MAKLPSIRAREVARVAQSIGFVLDRQAGAHQHYYRHTDHRRVTVSFHRPGETFPPKTLKRMLEDQAGWTEADLKRLGLLS